MIEEDSVRAHLNLLTGEATPAARSTKRRAGLRGMKMMSAAPAPVPAVADLAPWAAKGIAGYGMGDKVSDGQYTGEISLKLYVEKKLPLAKLDRPIPRTLELPGLPAIHTDVVEIGRLELQSNTQRIRPAIPGFSIGRALDAGEAGTFGMLVRKTGEPTPMYLLSNSHAIAASGFASKGDAVIQPGRADGGSATSDVIGTLSEWISFDYDPTGYTNTVDAAIAEMQPDVASAAIALLGTPKGVNLTLKRGDFVQKMGRTTALSLARVEDVDLRIPSTYPGADGKLVRVGFSDLVLVTFYSGGGDSGSPVLDMDGNIVGLHMCGSPTVGVFCKIGNVQTQLGVEVVTQ